MIGRAGAFVVACLAPWLAPIPVSAQRPADVATEWGLLGAWATSCAKPPGPGNAFTTYAVLPDGKVSATVEDGSAKSTKRPEMLGDPNKTVIFAASIRADGVLMSTESFAPIRASREIWFTKGRDGRRRVLLGRTNGRHWAAEGKVIDTGRETPWETRCR